MSPRRARRIAGRDARETFIVAREPAAPSPAAARPMSGDAIVIGGGPNGLAAAIRLARAGVPVTVLEQAEQPGGAVRSEELTLPGFVHDTFSAVYPAAVASPVFAEMPLAEHGLGWVHPTACMAHPLPDGSAAVLYRDLELTAATLDRQHPGDGARWAAFASPYAEAFDAVRNMMLAGFPPIGGRVAADPPRSPRARASASRAVLGGPRRPRAAPVRRRGLARLALPRSDPRTATPGFTLPARHLRLLAQPPRARGRLAEPQAAPRLTDALVGYLESLGATIQSSTRSNASSPACGRVSGVGIAAATSTGQGRNCRRHAHALITMTGDALTGWYRWAFRRYVYARQRSRSTGRSTIRSRGRAAEARQAGTVHVGGSEPGHARVHRSGGARSDRPPVPAARPAERGGSDRAPAGQHTAWAYGHGPAGIDAELSGDRHVEAIEQQVERFAPGFRDRILARHVLGPADLQADPNLIGGDVGGGAIGSARRVPADPVTAAVPDPVAGTVSRQRRDIPGRRRTRSTRQRRRPRRAPPPRISSIE